VPSYGGSRRRTGKSPKVAGIHRQYSTEPAFEWRSPSRPQRQCRYLYSPVLTQDEWLPTESHGFVYRLFGGRVAPLVSYFSQQMKLSKKDIENLKQLIKEIDGERRSFPGIGQNDTGK
jgi:hypothetical protein